MKSIMKKFLVSEVASVLVLMAAPPSSLAQCRPTKKERVVSSAIFAGLGALIGHAVAQNRGRGAAIGAGVGAAIGFAGAQDTNCVARERKRERAARQWNRAPYNNRIASANAPQPVTGKTVVVRSVNGADQETLEPVMEQALAHLGYTLIDRQIYDQNRMSVDYFIDVTVRQIDGSNGSGGGSYSQNLFSSSGNRAVGGGVYQVSVVMVNTATGQKDPTRSATEDVSATLYREGSGYVTISNLSGYGSHSWYTSDPQTGAAEEAINDFFGLGR